VRDDAFVFVVVDAAHHAVREAREVACEGVVVDQEPAGVLRLKASGEVAEGNQVIWL
jgi:hypothetical protein